jgi:hypothetical protein
MAGVQGTQFVLKCFDIAQDSRGRIWAEVRLAAQATFAKGDHDHSGRLSRFGNWLN